MSNGNTGVLSPHLKVATREAMATGVVSEAAKRRLRFATTSPATEKTNTARGIRRRPMASTAKPPNTLEAWLPPQRPRRANVFSQRYYLIACPLMTIEVPDTIVCVDCGYDSHRLTPTPPEGFAPGVIVAYRCSGCMDRWDVEFGPGEADRS